MLVALIIFGLSVATPSDTKNISEPTVPKKKHELVQTVEAKGFEEEKKAEKVALPKPVPNRIYCQTHGNDKPVNTANAAIGRNLARAHGWTGAQWQALLELWACESEWEHRKANYEGSGAYGIPQSLPANKMATHGSDYLTNPTTQIAWGLEYIANRYGTPTAALQFHRINNWY